MKKVAVIAVLTLIIQHLLSELFVYLTTEEEYPIIRCDTFNFTVDNDQEIIDARHLMYNLALEKRFEFRDVWVPSDKGIRLIIGRLPNEVVLTSSGGPWSNHKELTLIRLGGGIKKRKGITTNHCSRISVFSELQQAFESRWPHKAQMPNK